MTGLYMCRTKNSLYKEGEILHFSSVLFFLIIVSFTLKQEDWVVTGILMSYALSLVIRSHKKIECFISFILDIIPKP